jgi:Domain of unknown function (DUF4124)
MRKFLTLTASASLIAVCLVASGAGQGDIYRWKDSSGTWHYSDQPQPGAELVRGTNKPPPPPAPPVAALPPAAPTATGAAAAAANAQVTEQVRQDVAAAKIEKCKKAEDIYAQSVQARRMYKVDAQGNKTFLNESELDEARVNAKIQRDNACN